MIIGIDFDNTIVCYDEAFHRAACEGGLIPADIPATKEQVRDYLRNIGQEDSWTELQGYVYGSRMDMVEPFSGVTECIRFLMSQGADVYIISHKTLYPYRGARYNLHDAARSWLLKSCFLRDAGLDMHQVFFETTKDEKLARIGNMGCTHFIDDLPEIFSADGFPPQTTPLLFAPENQAGGKGMLTFVSWKDIAAYFRGSDAG
ncbi:MAG: hypothetical protein WC405_11020 [Syntrophales bacterium]